jgi:two-component system, NarL family, invasion response regulator UvrY
MPKINLAIADDHTLIRKAIANLLDDGLFSVIVQAENGIDLIEKIKDKRIDILLLDISMPLMNGFETAHWIRQNRPEIKVLALSMFADEASVIRMIKMGAKGYILKDAEPHVLRNAIFQMYEQGIYYSELITDKMINTMGAESVALTTANITDREEEFLKHLCSELTLKEIAERMSVSPRTVDGYRDQLFQKLNLQTRTGLVLYAIKNRICFID